MILNSTDGFAVGPTTNAKTKGIWVWGKPLISHNQMVERADIASEILGLLIVAIRNCDWGAHLNFVGLLIASLFISKVGN